MRNYLDVRNVSPRHRKLYEECSKYLTQHFKKEKREEIEYNYRPCKFKYNKRYRAWMDY